MGRSLEQEVLHWQLEAEAAEDTTDSAREVASYWYAMCKGLPVPETPEAITETWERAEAEFNAAMDEDQ